MQKLANEVNNAGKACKLLMPGPLRRPGPSKRSRLVLQRDEQTGQALEGLLHVQHAFSDGSCGGEVHHETPAHLNGEGKLRHEAAPHLLPKAMEVNGDGEVQHDGSTHSQPKAKEVNEAALHGEKGGGAGAAALGQARPPHEAALQSRSHSEHRLPFRCWCIRNPDLGLRATRLPLTGAPNQRA